jgi:hypothetical protein
VVTIIEFVYFAKYEIKLYLAKCREISLKIVAKFDRKIFGGD